MAGTRKLRQLSAIRRASCGVACAACLVQAEVCLAQSDAPVELSWDAPEGCPQQPEVLEQVRVLVGAAGEISQPSRLRVSGIIEPFDERYRLTLLIERKAMHGTRVIESDDCQSLGKAAAVVVGLLVRRQKSGDELSESDISGKAETPKPTVGAQPTVKPPLRTAPQASSISRVSPWRAVIRGPSVNVDSWTLPRPSAGVSVGAGVAYYDWKAFVSGGLWMAQTKASSGLQPYLADFRRMSFEVWACRGWRLSAFELAPCALAALDDMKASASGGGRVPTARRGTWPSAGGGISAYWHFHRNIAFVATGSGRIMLGRPEFVVEGFSGVDQAHKVPFGTLVASLGCEWIF